MILRKYFLNILLAQAINKQAPLAGRMIIADSVPLNIHYQYKNDKNEIKQIEISSKLLNTLYSVENIDFEINEGFIQNLKTDIKYKDDKKTINTFILPFPVGISTVSNLKSFKKIELVELNSPIKFLAKKSKETKSEKLKIAKNNCEKIDSSITLYLSDLIKYDYKLGIDRRDYSPENIIISMKGGRDTILNKQVTSKLFEANFFTDFVGLQEEKPNGLVQVEVAKRINLNTVQRFIKSDFLRNNFFQSSGYFNYLKVVASFTKIEEHNRELILKDLDSLRRNTGNTVIKKFKEKPNRYTSFTELFQHQFFAGGIDLNLLYLNNFNTKWDISINGCFRLGLTSTVDSLTTITQEKIQTTGITKKLTIPVFQIYPEVRMRFLPEERFNFSLINKFIYYKPASAYIQTTSKDKSDYDKIIPQKKTWIFSPEMLFTLNLSEEIGSKMFGKLTFNCDMKNFKDNFSQIQVGYSTYILGRSNKK